MRVTSIGTYARAFSGPHSIHSNIRNYRNSNWAIAGKTAAFVCGIIPGLVVIALEQVLIVGPKQREVARNSKTIFDALVNRDHDQDSVTVTLSDQGIDRVITLTQSITRGNGETISNVTFSEDGEKPCVIGGSFEDILTKIRTDWEANQELYPDLPELVMSDDRLYKYFDLKYPNGTDFPFAKTRFEDSLRNLLFFVIMPKTKPRLFGVFKCACLLTLVRNGESPDVNLDEQIRYLTWLMFEKRNPESGNGRSCRDFFCPQLTPT